MGRCTRMRWRALLPLLALVLLAACDSGAAEGDGATDRIVIALDAEPASGDMQLDSGGYFAESFGYNIIEPIVRKDKDDRGVVRPGIAEGWEQTTETTWRFDLQEGISFHNGDELTADDVVWSLERIMDPDVGSTFLSYLETFESVKALDTYTVEVTTDKPDPIVPTRMYKAPIVPADSTDEELATKPIGTGPYEWTEWTSGESLRLRANPEYWRGEPPIDEVVFVARGEARTRAGMIQTGEADLAVQLSADGVDTLGSENVIESPSLEVVFLRFGTENDIVRDVRVRQAMVMAIDYDAVVNDLLGIFGSPASGAQIITEEALGYNSDLGQYPYDPEEARRLIKEAGAEGASITLSGRPDFFPGSDELSEYLTTAWREIGLDADLQLLDSTQFTEKIFAVAPEDGPADVILGRHANDWYDSSQTMGGYLACGERLSTVCDEELDRLVREAARTTDLETRAEIYREAWARAQEIVPTLGIAELNIAYGVSEDLVWEGPPIDQIIDLMDVSTGS